MTKPKIISSACFSVSISPIAEACPTTTPISNSKSSRLHGPKLGTSAVGGFNLAAEHDADIGGVLLRRIEIGVARNRERQMQRDIRQRHQCPVAQFPVVAQLRMIVTQQFADPRPRLRPHLRSQRHERIERW